MKAVVLASVLLLSAAAGRAATGAALFDERCSPCHTIGGGDQAGPDLVAAKRLAHGDLRAAVDRMQINVGPLSAADIDALVVFLASAAPPGAAPKPALPRGVAPNGRRLFFGDKALANGGSPCFACHAIEGRGGNLAADLTKAKANVAAVATQPPFPMMKAAYGRHAVTDAEALDLAAFVAEASVGKRERVGVLHGAATGLALIGFGVVAITVKRRGVRARLVGRNKP
jgi:mono/diheme cytochrome c family protein